MSVGRLANILYGMLVAGIIMWVVGGCLFYTVDKCFVWMPILGVAMMTPIPVFLGVGTILVDWHR